MRFYLQRGPKLDAVPIDPRELAVLLVDEGVTHLIVTLHRRPPVREGRVHASDSFVSVEQRSS